MGNIKEKAGPIPIEWAYGVKRGSRFVGTLLNTLPIINY